MVEPFDTRAQLNPRDTLSRGRWIGAVVAVALALVGALALAPPAGGAIKPSCSSKTLCIRPAAAHSRSHGYWLVGRDGGIFSFGAAQFYGSTGALRLQRPVVGIAATPDHGGYWLVAADGGVFAFGDAGFYGSLPGLGFAPAGTAAPLRLNAPVVGIVPSRGGGGYFMVASDGGVFAFGDAPFEGSCPGIGGCAGAGHVVMPANGNGYWLVTRTGHVYAFGDAPYLGGAGGKGYVTSATGTRNGRGYWILLRYGVVFHYGNAKNFGSLPRRDSGGYDIATAIFNTAQDDGYWIATAAGAVVGLGYAPNEGSMAGRHLNRSIISAVGW